MADALNSSLNGDIAASLDKIAKLVAHVEGDDHAISSKVFPEIVVQMILLVGELGSKPDKE